MLIKSRNENTANIFPTIHFSENKKKNPNPNQNKMEEKINVYCGLINRYFILLVSGA